MPASFPALILQYSSMPDICPFQLKQQYVDAIQRQNLIDRFNALVGVPNKIVTRMQHDFVLGQMAAADAHALVTLYEYTIDAAENIPQR
jgi:hypothetical protein